MKTRASIAAVGGVALLVACGGGEPEVAMETGPTMADRVAQFAPVTLDFDASLLDDRQKRVMRRLVEASDHLDAIYRLQVWRGNAEPSAILPNEDTPEAAAIRDYYELMYGPWDRIADDEPFVSGVGSKPAGAGSYPEDMTKEEFDEWIGLNRGDAEAFTSYYTVIERDNGGLRAVPYSQAYVDHLEAAAGALRDAAEYADNPSLERFLRLRAESFLTDDYFDSEIAWMRLEDNLIDPTIGPYEVYEDNLFGYKASFESFIGFRDPEASAQLASLAARLPDLERALPIPDEHKYLDRDFTSPISVIDLVYGAGETRPGVQTIAFNLPNDPRVRETEGSKKVMLRNVIRAKFETNLKPIAAQVLIPEQADRIGFEPYFTRVLVHELAHGLGPDYVTGNPDLTVNKALQEHYSALEEAKADAVGTHSLRVLVERGDYSQDFYEEVLIDHVADMFRCVRFGATEAHGLGCLTQFNYLRSAGAITWDERTGRFAADLDVMPGAISDLAGQYLLLQATGDRAGAAAFLERYGEMSPEMEAAIERLDGVVPVDIRPSYSVKELMASW
ncbi:MAG: peptidase [marine benthic group bacterium]|nr:peptidase [Gemmatimonadota bacterium]